MPCMNDLWMIFSTKAFATHELKMTALFVRYCKDHTISCMRPKMMITCKLWKEWVAIVVTNYGREPNVKEMERCKKISEWKWTPLLHKERFPIPISWSHGPKWPAVQGHKSSMLYCIACSCSPHNVLHSPSFTVRYSTSMIHQFFPCTRLTRCKCAIFQVVGIERLSSSPFVLVYQGP